MDVNRIVEVFPTAWPLFAKGRGQKNKLQSMESLVRWSTYTDDNTTTRTIFEISSKHGFSFWSCNISVWGRQLGLGTASSGLSSFGCLQHTFRLVYKPTDFSINIFHCHIKLLYIGVSLFAEGSFTCYVDELHFFFFLNQNFSTL